ncbi:carbohydrate-binding protein [Reticulibacter mediterranei]|uniref:carbohydrate-binding protein n=1 Tax=Reticulibacter mediterranei TaxID=2778369 RepID=UPI001C6893E0|nr:carbohydrate-binding protein [Reticulibacter mediterranei]
MSPQKPFFFSFARRRRRRAKEGRKLGTPQTPAGRPCTPLSGELESPVAKRRSLVFSAEDLQSTWLSVPYQHLYRWSLRLLVGLSSGLLFGPACVLAASLWGGKPVSPSFGVICGLLFGALCGLLLFRLGKGLRPEGVIPWQRSLSKGVISWSLFGGLCLGIAVGGATAYTYGGSPLLGWIFILCSVVLMGLPIALFFPCWEQVFSGFPLSSDEDTQSVWHGLLLWLANVLLLGLYTGVFVGIPLFSLPSQPQTLLSQALFFALFLWLVVMLQPIGLLICLPACLRVGPAWLPQPLLLRLFLLLSGVLPWDLLSVLEQAAESGLLHNVDGGYRLSSRLLLSYVDSLDQSIPSHVAELQEPFTVASFPPFLVRGQPAIIIYDGLSLAAAQCITIHWGHNDWRGTTDTVMCRSRDGSWHATIMVPPEATVLDMAFCDSNGTWWDNHQHNDYHLPVEECLALSLRERRQIPSRWSKRAYGERISWARWAGRWKGIS